MKIKFPCNVVVDTDNIPQDFEEQIRASFEAYTKGTAEAYVINLTTGEVFKSRKEAAQKYNRTPEAISAAIHGKCRTCARCEWRYA